jgi:hypothetical protein
MKITKKATSYENTDMEMEAEGGDFLPRNIKINHNDKHVEYNQGHPHQQCPVCNNSVDIIPSNPMWDWPATATTYPDGGVSGTYTIPSFTVTGDQPVPETKRTYKCVNSKCWVTKIRVEWE